MSRQSPPASQLITCTHTNRFGSSSESVSPSEELYFLPFLFAGFFLDAMAAFRRGRRPWSEICSSSLLLGLISLSSDVPDRQLIWNQNNQTSTLFTDSLEQRTPLRRHSRTFYSADCSVPSSPAPLSSGAGASASAPHSPPRRPDCSLTARARRRAGLHWSPNWHCSHPHWLGRSLR